MHMCTSVIMLETICLICCGIMTPLKAIGILFGFARKNVSLYGYKPMFTNSIHDHHSELYGQV